EIFTRQRIADGLTMHRGGKPGVVAQHAENALAAAARARDRRAHVERIEGGKLVEMLLDKIGELEEDLLAVEWLEAAPRPLEGSAGGGNGTVDIGGIAL